MRIETKTLLACIRFHQKQANLEHKISKQMFTKKWKNNKVKREARKHDNFANAIIQLMRSKNERN